MIMPAEVSLLRSSGGTNSVRQLKGSGRTSDLDSDR